MAVRNDFTAGEVLAAADLNDTFASKLDASAYNPAILQVVQVVRSETFSASVGNGAESGDFISATITPSSASNKVLVFLDTNLAGTEPGVFLRLYRSTTRIYQGDAASNRQLVSSSTRSVETATPMNVTAVFLDSPSTTSATTYAGRVSHQNSGSATVYVNRGVSDTDTEATPRTASSITLMEVKA
jgi:hypothetical protein